MTSAIPPVSDIDVFSVGVTGDMNAMQAGAVPASNDPEHATLRAVLSEKLERPDMARVEVDRSRCEGHGLCEQTAPQIYRLDDDGELEMLVDDIPPGLRAAAEAGARVCPVAALRVHW